MVQAIRANNPDLMGAQEINDHAFEVIGHLGTDYQVSSFAIMLIKINFESVKKKSSAIVFGENDQKHRWRAQALQGTQLSTESQRSLLNLTALPSSMNRSNSNVKDRAFCHPKIFILTLIFHLDSF